jgi:threonine/homoserine/homoserine lactone efflux protein
VEALIGVAALIVVAAITPGPNNLVVMQAAARGRAAGAVPAIVGIVLGSLALLAVVVAGAGAAFEVEPRLRTALAVGGCLYLSWLGLQLVVRTFRADTGPTRVLAKPLPAGILGLFGFQFLNPKSWVMVLTATAAGQSSAGVLATFLRLSVLFVVIPAICLALWSSLGFAMARVLERPTVRRWFDRGMGLLLVGSAALLLKET